jgi:TPR repeat protein
MKNIVSLILFLSISTWLFSAEEIVLNKRDAKMLDAIDKMHLMGGKEALQAIDELVAKNDPVGKYLKAYAYGSGYGWVAKIDNMLSRRLYAEACREIIQNPQTGIEFYYASVCYRGEYGVAVDKQKEEEYLARSMKTTVAFANKGSVNMQIRLGSLYAYGKGVPKDEKESLKWYRLAAAQGSPVAQFDIGRAYEIGIGGLNKDSAEAFRWYRMAADNGYAYAQRNLGLLYYNGVGITKNIPDAFKWFKMAAQLGEPYSQWHLGWMYMNGEGVTKDEKEGVKWHMLAADNGNSYAQNSLGAAYERGIGGLNKDLTEAIKWYKKGADGNNSDAMTNLGRLYMNGIGVNKDMAEAAKWYRLAAESGSTRAMTSLAWMYMTGSGIAIDQNEAMKWYKTAAEKGYVPAQYRVGYMYGQGLGVSQDLMESYAWSNLAASSVVADAETKQGATAYRNMIAKKLTSDQLYQARVRSGELDIQIKMLMTNKKADNKQETKVSIKQSDIDELSKIVSTIQPAKEDNTKWLFVVAVEKYDETDSVVYASASAKAFVEAMQRRLGISERQTYALIDDKATTGSIKTNLERLVRHVNAGDTIYFYYSGHGIPESKDGEAYILPKDASPEFVGSEKEFMVRNIYKKLSSSKASKIIAFIDSCYSGRTDGVSNIKGVAAGHFKTKKVQFDTSKMVVLTAGSSSQFSNAFQSKKHRLFTYYLTKALAERPTLDVKSIYQEVAVKVKDESFKMGDAYLQEPQIEGNLGLGL